MIKLNDNNIIVGQIKQLLHTFPLPQCQIGDLYPTPNTHFIFQNNIKRWEQGNDTLNIIDCEKYVFGKEYLNLTSTLPIRNNIYDRETHRYLGKYLRFLRDYYNVNLMSMYNCCDNDFNTHKFIIEALKGDPDNNGDRKRAYISFQNGSDDCKVFKIPVSISPFTITSHNSSILEICVYIDDSSISKQDIIKKIAEITYFKRSSNPIIYYSPFDNITTDQDPEIAKFIFKHLNKLYLLVKVHGSVTSNLTVLEGTYLDKANPYEQYFLYMPSVKAPSKESANILLLAKDVKAQKNTLLLACQKTLLLARSAMLETTGDIYASGFKITAQLLSYMNAQNDALLADRLIEYLTGNAITPLSEPYEIKRVQQTLNNIRSIKSLIPSINEYQRKYGKVITSSNLKTSNRYFGIWHNQDYLDLKAIAYASGATQEYDTLGYLDKTLESKLKGVLDNVNV